MVIEEARQGVMVDMLQALAGEEVGHGGYRMEEGGVQFTTIGGEGLS